MQDAALRFFKDNATTVLTAGGVIGTVTTAALSFRAGAKYNQLVFEETLDRIGPEARAGWEADVATTQPLSRADKARIVAPHLIPPVVLGTATVGSIVLSHQISASKAAALAAAYSVSQRNFEDYKAKLEEKLGVQKQEKAKAEMAQERANRTPGANAVVIFGDEVLCFDEPTGRYFKGTMEKIRQAQNKCNQTILEVGYADASEFYSLIDLPGTRWSDDVGWDKPFNVTISTIVHDDKPCLSLDFDPLPVLDYNRKGTFHRYS